MHTLFLKHCLRQIMTNDEYFKQALAGNVTGLLYGCLRICDWRTLWLFKHLAFVVFQNIQNIKNIKKAKKCPSRIFLKNLEFSLISSNRTKWSVFFLKFTY